MKTRNKQLSVGFDLDGVILYNPARIARPIIAFFKKYFLKRDTTKFYYPKNTLEQCFWSFLHKSSVWPAPGINDLIRLIKKNKIKAYVVSARYESLKSDFNNWMKKIDPEKTFSGYYYNDKNDQPHLYKEAMIKKLKLDIFVEDNWDIVAHLRDKFKAQNSCLPAGRAKLKICWIYNIFDRYIHYKYKYSSLTKVIEAIKLDL